MNATEMATKASHNLQEIIQYDVWRKERCDLENYEYCTKKMNVAANNGKTKVICSQLAEKYHALLQECGYKTRNQTHWALDNVQHDLIRRLWFRGITLKKVNNPIF